MIDLQAAVLNFKSHPRTQYTLAKSVWFHHFLLGCHTYSCFGNLPYFGSSLELGADFFSTTDKYHPV